MDWKRVLRTVVCLVLVCTLLIVISPIRSNAYLIPGFSDDVVCTVLILTFLAANGFVISPANFNFNLQFCEDVSDSFDYFLEEQLDYGGFIDTDGDGDPDDDDERDPTDDEILEAVNKLKSDKTKYQKLLNQVGAPPRWTDLDYTIAQWGSGLFNAYTEFIRFCAERGFFDTHPAVDIPSGKALYNGYLYKAAPAEDLANYWFILCRRNSDTTYYLRWDNYPDYTFSCDSSDKIMSSRGYFYQKSCSSSSSSWNLTDYGISQTAFSLSNVLWTNYDILYPDGSVAFPASAPLYNNEDIIQPIAIVPDSAAAGIAAGGVASAIEIFLPDGVDLTSIFEGVSAGDYAALQSNLVASAEGLANGSVTINNYQQSITYNYDTGSDNEDDSTDASDPTGGSGDNENTGSDSSDSENNGSDSSDSEQKPVEGTFANFPVLDFFSRLGQLLQDIFDGNLLGVKDFFEPLLSGIREDLSDIDTSVQDGFDGVVDSNQDINDSVKDIFDQNQEMQDSVKDEFQNQNEIIAQESQSLSDRLLNGLQSLFTPSEGFIDDHLEDLRKNYSFADSIALTAKDLESFLTNLGSVPPVIRINLGAASTGYNIGGEMVFIDFSFYEPYKASMDAVLSAFLWLWFCWRVVLNLPGIISGVSGIVGGFPGSSDAGSRGYVQLDHFNSNDYELREYPLFLVHGYGSPGSTSHYNKWLRERHDANYNAYHKK